MGTTIGSAGADMQAYLDMQQQAMLQNEAITTQSAIMQERHSAIKGCIDAIRQL